MLEIVVQWEFP